MRNIETLETTQNSAPCTESEAIARKLESLLLVQRNTNNSRPKKLRLLNTLTIREVTQPQKVNVCILSIPAWLNPRLENLFAGGIIMDFTCGCYYLSDPISGQETREKFVNKWARVMECRPLWAARDKGPTVEIELAFTENALRAIRLTTDFLNVEIEMFLLAVLFYEGTRRSGKLALMMHGVGDFQNEGIGED